MAQKGTIRLIYSETEPSACGVALAVRDGVLEDGRCDPLTFGQGINDSTLLQVFSELFFLGIWCLIACHKCEGALCRITRQNQLREVMEIKGALSLGKISKPIIQIHQRDHSLPEKKNLTPVQHPYSHEWLVEDWESLALGVAKNNG